MLSDLRKEIRQFANPEKAKILQRFFKTGKGEYGEGDVFAGLIVPQSRSLAVKYKDLGEKEIVQLFKSNVHEERLIAVLILVHNFKKGSKEKKKTIVDFYLKNLEYVNNWDLVDLSADKILGAYLADKDKNILIKLAKTDHLWSKRVAMISTYYFIKYQKSSEWTFKIADILLHDSHDLIHKAVGWMLKEVGKHISQSEEEIYLKKHYQQMPRTMLRYAIEKFTPELRAKYMKRKGD
jgi:3-methyladenine DNA glycosylase AlkD